MRISCGKRYLESDNLPKKNLWITLTVHNFAAAEYYKLYWPTIKHVCLVNNEQFSKYTLPKKNIELNYDSDWATLGRTPIGTGFNFDVDNTVYNTDTFLDQVEKLYEYLEFDDFIKIAKGINDGFFFIF